MDHEPDDHRPPSTLGLAPGLALAAAGAALLVFAHYVFVTTGQRAAASIHWDELTEEKIAAIPLLSKLRP